MASSPTQEQAISLLSAAKNHADLAVKLSSLKQAKEILLSIEPSLAAQLFPYIVDLHTSSEFLVRKFLIELVEELSLKVMDQSPVLIPILLSLLNDDASVVVRHSIVSSMHIYCSCLEELALQFQKSGKVERWLYEHWTWMIKLKDAILGIALKPGSVSVKLLAVKFVEMHVLLFTADANGFETSIREGKRKRFNISLVSGGHPILDPALLASEANKSLGLLLELFQSTNAICGSQMIAVINCL